MDTFRKFLIFFIVCIIFHGCYGRKWHAPYKGSSRFTDESELVEGKLLNIYPEKTKNDKHLRNLQLFKINDVSKEFQQTLPQYDKNPSELNSDDFETLETQVGEHLVKVTSKKESKSSSHASKSGGYDISINPKYSHIVEIIHRGDNIDKQNKPTLMYGTAVQKQAVKLKLPDSVKTAKTKFSENPYKFGETSEENLEKFEVDEEDEEDAKKSDQIDGEFETEEDTDESVASEEDPQESNETDTEGFCEYDVEDLQEYDETEEDTKEFDFQEDHEESLETEKDSELFEIDHEGDSDEFGEIEDTDEFGETNQRHPEEYDESEEDLEKSEIGESDVEFSKVNEKNPYETDESEPEAFEVDEINIMNSTKTDENLPGGIEDAKQLEGDNNTKKNEMSNEQISNDTSSFNEELEGSGEVFVIENDSNTTKNGRILGILSRRNETFPTCTTQRGEAGHCRRLGECLLSEALSNFNGFLQQLCLIRGALVGICCPDNPVIETVNPDDTTTNELSAEEIEQPPEGCGLNTKTRIVGGSISVPHEWTWMVALMRRNRFYCGGVIINNWYILTAAHCVMGMNVKDLTVRLGEYDFNEQGKHTEDLSVSEIKRHAQFVTLTFQHDIALLKLKRSIKYSKFVGSICLPEQNARDYSDVKGTVVGWGTVSFGGAASPILRQVTVPVWKNEDCDRTYLLERIGDSFMCAGSPEKGEDACQGDSGGPLMTVNENGRWEVIGLVSWGRRCGDPTYPGVYTRVTTYLDWIKQNAV